jgi:hypothetical protein
MLLRLCLLPGTTKSQSCSLLVCFDTGGLQRMHWCSCHHAPGFDVQARRQHTHSHAPVDPEHSL